MPRGELAQATGFYRSYAQMFREKLVELDAAIKQADFDFATTYSTDWHSDYEKPGERGLDQSIFFKYWRPFVSAWNVAREQLRTGEADRAAALGLAYWAERFADLKRSAGASLGLYTSAPDVVIQGVAPGEILGALRDPDADILQVMHWTSGGGAESEEVVRKVTSKIHRIVLIKETNKRFWAQTNYKPGQKLDMSDPKDRAMAKIWLRIFSEVQGHRDRATKVARSIYGETFTPYIFVGEKFDGTLSHQAFQQRGELDVLYASVLGQPGLYAYVAMFDLTKDPHGPLFDNFSAAADPAEQALAGLRETAKGIAQRSSAGLLGAAVSASGKWFTPAFTTDVEGAAWLARVSAHPTEFAYAAYFDKAGPMWPLPTGEAIGHGSAPLPVA